MAKMPKVQAYYNPSSAAPGYNKECFIFTWVHPFELMIENCKIYLIKGSRVYSQTFNLYTVEVIYLNNWA